MSENNPESIDGLNTSGLVTAGFVAAVGTFVIIIGLQALYLRYSREMEIQNQSKAVLSTESLIAEQQAKINRYGWLDRENDVVAIPIDRAIELTAREYDEISAAEKQRKPEKQ